MSSPKSSSGHSACEIGKYQQNLVKQAIHYGDLTGGAFDISVKPLLDLYQTGTRDVQGTLSLVDYRQIRVGHNAIVFDRPGMSITLDSIAKGRVVDAATAVLKSNGVDNILVEAGGDLAGYGHRADGSPWRVGLANPRRPGQPNILSVLPVQGQAVATSGDYMNSFTNDFRLHHIIDPRTGISPADLASVTVVAPSATQADALSTALMVMGSAAGLTLVNRLSGVEALLITKELQA
ncbi:MAG: FAD:protein FMN transferase, partial [Chloroflexota bacterium]